MMKPLMICGLFVLAACSEASLAGPTIKERAQIGFSTGGWDPARIQTKRCFELFPNFFTVVGEMRSMTEVARYFTANGVPTNPNAPPSVGDIDESNPARVKITYHGISSMFGDMDPHDMEVAACFLE